MPGCWCRPSFPDPRQTELTTTASLKGLRGPAGIAGVLRMFSGRPAPRDVMRLVKAVLTRTG